MAGLYWRISEEVPDSHAELKIWLADMSKRPAPFMDFYIKGLPEAHRITFYAAAQNAMTRVIEQGNQELTGSANRLNTLLKMKASLDRGEPPLTLSDSDHTFEFSEVHTVDLSEIWEL
jgi:hypothetical protein